MSRWLFYLIFLSALLSSCVTERKAFNYLHNNKPSKEKFLAENCQVKVLDPIVKIKDTTIFKEVTLKGDSIPCPPNEKGETIFVKCPDHKFKYPIITKTIEITSQVENKSRIDYLEKFAQLYYDQKKKSDKKDLQIIALICFIGLSIYLRIKKVI